MIKNKCLAFICSIFLLFMLTINFIEKTSIYTSHNHGHNIINHVHVHKHVKASHSHHSSKSIVITVLDYFNLSQNSGFLFLENDFLFFKKYFNIRLDKIENKLLKPPVLV